MRDTIDQFMWGFQRSFRRGLESDVSKIVLELGCPAAATAYLVGVLEPGGTRHPLCIEPEDGPLTPADFDGVSNRASELYGEDPESSMRHSDPRTHERRHRWARERAFGAAIGEVVERQSGGLLRCLVGYPAVVEQHLVYPVVALPAHALDPVPRFRKAVAPDGRTRVAPSIIHEAINESLRRASREMNLPGAGEAADVGVDANEVKRAASERFVHSAAVLTGNLMAHWLFDALNRVCTMKYERRVGVGRLLLARRGTTGVSEDFDFKSPVALRETRTLRKLLELSGRESALLTDGDEVFGLGRLNDSYDPTTETVFELLVLGDGVWELRHDGVGLVTVEYGTPRLPAQRVRKAQFADVAGRVFAASGCDIDALWTLILSAAEAEHGTMLVVSADAAGESQRLRSQSLPIAATPLTPDVLENVTRIDGAVLVDPAGLCHGLGVILDGPATESGDRSRGARFNSAVKYLASARSETVIVIVSEDGMINILPELRPRLRRAEIVEAMAALRAASSIEPVHPERFYKAFDHVKEIAFYLSRAECEEANRLCEEHWDRRRAAGATIWLNEQPLGPHPDMNDTYLL